MKVQRPGLVVAVAILLSLTMAPGILSGAIAPTTALVRFLIALLLCWAGGALLGGVLRRYTEESRRAEVTRMIEHARQRAAQQAAARRGDGPTPPGAPPAVS